MMFGVMQCSGQWPFYGAAAILHEKHLGPASDLETFFDLLPESVDTPRRWSSEDLAAMQYSEIVGGVSLGPWRHVGQGLLGPC